MLQQSQCCATFEERYGQCAPEGREQRSWHWRAVHTPYHPTGSSLHDTVICTNIVAANLVDATGEIATTITDRCGCGVLSTKLG
jgi:anaerobic selenocysteine-containing dehydrogenase